jgi:hypothetical protein
MSKILLKQVVGLTLVDNFALACDDALYDSDYYTTFGTLYEAIEYGVRQFQGLKTPVNDLSAVVPCI